MKIKRSVFEKIVKEELATYLESILEAGPSVDDAQDDNKKSEAPPKKQEKGKAKKPAADARPKDLSLDDEPADDELEKDVVEPEESESDEKGGDISDEVVGKTIQSITMEPKSKLVPGALEIVITFDQITDPLRVIVLKSGQVKFFFRGLHNEL